MAAITRSQIAEFLWPGLALIIADAKYWPNIYKKVFDVIESKKAYEVTVEYVTTGYSQQMNEGTGFTTQPNYVLSKTQFDHISYGSAVEFTFEAVDDNLYAQSMIDAGEQIKSSNVVTRDLIATNLFNFAFSTSRPIGDGQPLASTQHPTSVGVYSNYLANAVFSEAALTDMITLAETLPDASGKVLNYEMSTVMCHPALKWDVARVIGNPDRPATANRDIGAIFQMDAIKDGLISNPYMTNTKAVFGLTDAPKSLVFFEKNMGEVSTWVDEKQRMVGMGAFDRYSAGASNARGVICLQGY